MSHALLLFSCYLSRWVSLWETTSSLVEGGWAIPHPSPILLLPPPPVVPSPVVASPPLTPQPARVRPGHLPLGSFFTVVVSEVVSPSLLYLQRAEQLSSMAVLNGELSSWAAGRELEEGWRPEQGQVVLVQDQEGWERAQVTEVLEQGVELFLPDTGERLVTTSSLLPCPPHLLRLPAQAVACALQGVIPLSGGEWGEEAGETLFTHSRDPCDLPLVMVCQARRAGGGLEVRLVDTLGGRDRDLGEELVCRGLACWQGGQEQELDTEMELDNDELMVLNDLPAKMFNMEKFGEILANSEEEDDMEVSTKISTVMEKPPLVHNQELNTSLLAQPSEELPPLLLANTTLSQTLTVSWHQEGCLLLLRCWPEGGGKPLQLSQVYVEVREDRVDVQVLLDTTLHCRSLELCGRVVPGRSKVEVRGGLVEVQLEGRGEAWPRLTREEEISQDLPLVEEDSSMSGREYEVKENQASPKDVLGNVDSDENMLDNGEVEVENAFKEFLAEAGDTDDKWWCAARAEEVLECSVEEEERELSSGEEEQVLEVDE